MGQVEGRAGLGESKGGMGMGTSIVEARRSLNASPASLILQTRISA